MTLRKDSVDFYFVYDEQIKGHIFFQLLSLSALYVSTPASHWWCDRFTTRGSRTNLDAAAPVNAMHKTKTKRKEHKINNLPTHDMDRPLILDVQTSPKHIYQIQVGQLKNQQLLTFHPSIKELGWLKAFFGGFFKKNTFHLNILYLNSTR